MRVLNGRPGKKQINIEILTKVNVLRHRVTEDGEGKKPDKTNKKKATPSCPKENAISCEKYTARDRGTLKLYALH